jgi:hypothetical protein
MRLDLRRVWSAEYSSLSQEVTLLGSEGQRIGAIPDLGGLDYARICELCRAINERAARRGAQKE